MRSLHVWQQVHHFRFGRDESAIVEGHCLAEAGSGEFLLAGHRHCNWNAIFKNFRSNLESVWPLTTAIRWRKSMLLTRKSKEFPNTDRFPSIFSTPRRNTELFSRKTRESTVFQNVWSTTLYLYFTFQGAQQKSSFQAWICGCQVPEGKSCCSRVRIKNISFYIETIPWLNYQYITFTSLIGDSKHCKNIEWFP